MLWRSWERARILHAFDKLADNFTELLQAQAASDEARAQEQQSREQSGERDEEEEDLMDSLGEERGSLVQENIVMGSSNTRYRFRNSVADTLFNLERSNLSRSSSRDEAELQRGSPEKDRDSVEGEEGRRCSTSPLPKSANNGIGVYEVLLHSRQLGESSWWRAVRPSVHMLVYPACVPCIFALHVLACRRVGLAVCLAPPKKNMSRDCGLADLPLACPVLPLPRRHDH